MKLYFLLILFTGLSFADYSAPDTNVCNRGIDSPARAGEVYDASTNAVCRYDVSLFGINGVYILQIDGDYKVEFSKDNNIWTTELTAPSWNYWTNKGPNKSMSPYYIDLSPYLPANYLFVRLSDNTPGNANGVRVLNAQLLQRGYPEFYAGGAEPNIDPFAGDQSFLFEKNNTSDSVDQGRTALNNKYFIYKFDLPDDENNCKLFANVSGEYRIEISTNYDFSTVLYSTQNSAGDTTSKKLRINLENILSQCGDNLIYFKMADSNPTETTGGNLKELWITPQVSADKMTFHPYDEIETAFLWENNGSKMTHGNIRFADATSSFVYRFNFAESNSLIQIETDGEFLFQGSSNGVDWVNLFIGPSENINAQAETLIFNPFTGKATGQGAQLGIPILIKPFFDGWTNVFFLRVADADPSDGWGAQIKSISIILSETAVCDFESTDNSANLSYQPIPYDLAQMPGSTNYIIQGAMHSATPSPAGFNKIFDSDAVGSFGPDTSYNGCGIFQDGISAANDTIIFCKFDEPKTIEEIHFFNYWGDGRQFAYFEVQISTNDIYYSKIGTAINANYGETNNPPNTMIYRLARLYDPTTGFLASEVTSLKIIQKNVAYGIESGEGVILQPGTPQASYESIQGSGVNEIDIIGIPEPVTIYYLLFIINYLLIRGRKFKF